MGNGLNLRQVLLILRLRWPLVLALFALVIVVAYAQMGLEEARTFKPMIVFPDERTNTLKG